MNIELIQNKKGIPVMDHTCAAIKGWRMAFTMPSMDNALAALAIQLSAEFKSFRVLGFSALKAFIIHTIHHSYHTSFTPYGLIHTQP